MDFEELKKSWEALGERDPLWAVLSWNGKEKGSWDPEEFFKFGRWDVQRVFSQIEKLLKEFSPPFYFWQPTHLVQKLIKYPRPWSDHERRLAYIKARGRCLDFGCGVGRLTIPLAGLFREAYGIDISSTMIREAQKWADGKDNCTFLQNDSQDLSCFSSNYFHFILSLIVLQHIDPMYQTRYLTEFMRVLRPGGLAVFQLPDEFHLNATYSEYKAELNPEMEMHGMKPKAVREIIKNAGGRVLNILEDDTCSVCRSFRYFVTK